MLYKNVIINKEIGQFIILRTDISVEKFVKKDSPSGYMKLRTYINSFNNFCPCFGELIKDGFLFRFSLQFFFFFFVQGFSN